MFTCRICNRIIVVGGLTVELETKAVIPVHTSCFLLNTPPKLWDYPRRKQ